MFIFNPGNLAFIDVNNAALEQYGYTKDEFLLLSLKDLKPPEDMVAFYEINKGPRRTYYDAGVWKHMRKDGSSVHVHVFSSNIQFNDSRARLAAAISVDEEIKIKTELEEKNAEIQNILESITDGFFALNRNWRFTYINKEFERVAQRKREDVIGKTFWEIFPETGYMKIFAEYQKAMQANTAVHFEDFYSPLSLWISVNAYPSKEGIAVFFLDITQQKKIQEQLFNDRQNLSAIINNTRDIIWSIDRDFNIVTANKAFWDRLERITGKRVNTIVPEDYSNDTMAAWQEYYERAFNGEAFKITWIENNGETTRYDEVSFNPVYDRNNYVAGISCFSRDVTEQQNYQDKIEKQNKQLRQIAWLQSHKLRNHVANILGLVNLFNFNDGADPFNTVIINMVTQASTNLDEAIKEIAAHTGAPE